MGDIAVIGRSLASAENGERPLFHRIREDIIDGRLEAGTRLVVADLARRYDSSSNPVREALHQLQGEGFVVISQNRGARVRPVGEHFARDIYDIRALIEPYMIRWFTANATTAQISEMEKIQNEIEQLDGDHEAYRELNERFHSVSYAGHFNREAVDMEERYREILFMLNKRYQLTRGRWAECIQEHRGIVTAIKARDAEAAAAMTERHVHGACRHLIDHIRVARASEQAAK
ncbi:DNA-binding GntR family transcriptional regulator [Rhizobium azooxidifex]|uniref:DNA-binding GntR family transcriptional regulator n=1 Tax=Mycoplana azooxidifex TaxID=1636188 RepID=A0A7W6GLB7_9HYPH|nr:GntR family transcriptional regulator [Mycoplana azooxidifex]MBB3979996.1 DNA-binding GntR family transcriptional regulator [Mycoplana azooxidifex]